MWIDTVGAVGRTVHVACQNFIRLLWAYTLAKYREWMDEQHVELENICQRIVEFGKILAGPHDDILLPLLELILTPGIQFWGFKRTHPRTSSKQRPAHPSTKRL
jgi:hypothetical protein